MQRAFSPYLDDILGRKLPVLDHGFIRVIDYLGDDNAIVQAARVSYGEGTKTLREDKGLINYLMRHRHTSPFEMCEIKLHVKLPIFVARQWVRHRMANINEVSGRYSVLANEFYVPAPEEVRSQSATNKQGGGEPIDPVAAIVFGERLENRCQSTFSIYDRDLKAGVARELARIGLPLNTYTEWYWKTDLHNLMSFCALRADPHAQKEIRDYATVILELLRGWVPLTHEAFVNHRLRAHTLSGNAMDALRTLVEIGHLLHFDVDGCLTACGVEGREKAETLKALGFKVD